MDIYWITFLFLPNYLPTNTTINTPLVSRLDKT